MEENRRKVAKLLILFGCEVGSWLVWVVFLGASICLQSLFCQNGRQFYRTSETHSVDSGMFLHSPSSAFSSGDAGISALSTHIPSIFLRTFITEKASLLNYIMVISRPRQVLQLGQFSQFSKEPREAIAAFTDVME